MTTCIAAISNLLGAIMLVSDTMLSDDESSVDVAAVKFSILCSRPSPWICLYSGSEGAFNLLTDRMRKEIAQKSLPLSLSDIQMVAKGAYAWAISHAIEIEAAQVSGLSGAPLSNFVTTSTMERVEMWRERVLQRMYQYPTELLLCGFDERGDPHLVSVDHTCDAVPRDSYGFYALGAGAKVATGWLSAHEGFQRANSIDKIVYRLLEAKYASENARAAGPSTWIGAICSGGTSDDLILVDGSQHDTIRGAWRARRNQKLPGEALKSIRSILPNAIANAEHRISVLRGFSNRKLIGGK